VKNAISSSLIRVICLIFFRITHLKDAHVSVINKRLIKLGGNYHRTIFPNQSVLNHLVPDEYYAGSAYYLLNVLGVPKTDSG
jgi:hypothetical protein